jgi:hypothetical protein
MEIQKSFAQAEYAQKKKTTRREKFLNEMERVVPWARLVACIQPPANEFAFLPTFNMKTTSIHIAVFTLISIGLNFTAPVKAANGNPLNIQEYLTLTPLLKGATVKNGIVRIPFTATNNCDGDILVRRTRNEIDGLMTLDDSENKVFIESFQSGDSNFEGGGNIERVVLKPGESGLYYSTSPMETLRFVAERNRKIFGAITGYLSHTNQEFQSYSIPFRIPLELTKVPWADLGEQSYFSVIPDLTRTELQEIGEKTLTFPIKITNTTKRPYIAANNSVTWYLLREDLKGKIVNLWETIETSQPILKPGDITSH